MIGSRKHNNLFILHLLCLDSDKVTVITPLNRAPEHFTVYVINKFKVQMSKIYIPVFPVKP